MRRLIYCVFGGTREDRIPDLAGVDGRPVGLAARGGLCAAVSTVVGEPLVATLERIEAWERVVEAYFAERAVVPMRFGSLLDSQAAVCAFLAERGPAFREQLRGLEGSVEMGLRVLESPRPARSAQKAARPAAARPAAAPGSGRAYLEALAGRLPPEENPVERFRRAFRGLYTRLEVELPAPLRLVFGEGGKLTVEPGGPASDPLVAAAASRRGALNLAFLVPRDRVEQFRAAFARLPEKASCRLSGPWPPYSFVAR